MATKHDPSELAVMTIEMLKGVQTDVGIIKRDVADVNARLTSLEIVVGHMQTSIGQLIGRMDTMDLKIDRIKTRLGLSEKPNPAA